MNSISDLIDLCFDELFSYKAVPVLISMFEVHADPIFAVTTNVLNMPFSKLFSVRWHNHDQTRSSGGLDYSEDDAIDLTPPVSQNIH